MKRGPGRPPKNPELVAKAVDLCEREGITPEEAAERVKGTSQRTIYRALERRRQGRPAAPPAPLAAPTTPAGGAVSSAAPEPEKPPPVVVVEPVPPDLHGTARSLWIVRKEIDATRLGLATARAKGSGDRTAALQEQLRRLMQDERDLEPAAPPDPTEEDRRWRDDGARVVARIESGVAAVEARLRKERAATG